MKQKTYRLKVRILSFVLMLLTVFYAIPISVFAEAACSEEADELIEAKPATGLTETYTPTENAENVSYTYNTHGELATITTDSTTYTFTYDSFGNSSSVKAGNSTLATYEYNENNGKLIKVNYGNGYYERYIYNELEQLSEVVYNNGSGEQTAVRYTYNSDGSIASEEDVTNGTVKVYVYDTKGRLKEVGEYSTADNYYYLDEVYVYNTNSEISLSAYTLGYEADIGITSSELTNGYTYNDDGRLSSSYVRLGKQLNSTYEYDEFKLLEKIVYSVPNGFSNEVTYGYRSSGNYLSANEISSYTSKVGSATTSYTYTYDQRGNITKVATPNGEIRYYYDDLGQLVREDNTASVVTYLYTYDNAGNITAKYRYLIANENATPTDLLSVYNYTYDSTWGDRLSSYRGESFTYDAIGNPTSYYNGTRYTFAWQGRQLMTASKGGVSYSFEYNPDGLRVSKTVGNVEHTYYYAGTQLLAEQWGTHLMVFLYDAAGLPVGIAYRTSSESSGTWTNYWFERNLQGDVVAIYDNANTKLVSYTYDAWGNTNPVYSNGGGSIVPIVNNPIRYRGYYYDVDLGLYYLQTRYYDAKIGRFLNTDSALYHTMLGYNMYAYCNNNPITHIDYSGEFWESVWDIISLGLSIDDVFNDPSDPWAWAGLAGDVADVLIPFVGGIGEVVRGLKVVDDVADVVDVTHDIAKTANRVQNVIDATAGSIRYTDKVLKQMNNTTDLNHAFPLVIDTFVDINSGRPIKGGDGLVRNLIELPGSINNTVGIFEYIIEPNGMCNHRYFRKLR